MKKTLIVLLVCCLLAVFATTTLAAETVASGTCGKNLAWTLDDNGTLTISGTGPMTNYGYGDTPWHSQRSSITAVVIEEGATTVGDYAFYQCKGLTEVVFPQSLVRIGAHSFYDCEVLTSLALPQNVATLEEFAFMYCDGLTEVTIPDSVKTLENRAFGYCKGLTTVNLGSGVAYIDKDAFTGSSNLTEIRVAEGNPNFCTDEWGVLYNKDKTSLLKALPILSGSYSIPETVTVIGDYAFYGCNGLTAISLPANLSSIGSSAFGSCSGLTAIDIPETVTHIGAAAFADCTGLTAVSIPNGVTRLDGRMFSECFNLTSVTLPHSLTDIGYEAFYRCSQLTAIDIPGTVESIGSSAFAYCYGLKDVTIGEGVESIEDRVFYCCSNLKNLDIPSSVAYIGPYAFYNCTDLTEIEIPYGVEHITFELFYNCISLTRVTIPETVIEISIGAFENCSMLTDVKIPESVTEIGYSAFRNCTALTGIVIPEGVTTINFSVFQDCSSLSDIILPATINHVDSDAFWGCNNLSVVHYTGTAAQKDAIAVLENNDTLLGAAWHCDVAVYHDVQGQTVYHCPECDRYFLADGTEFQPKVEKSIEVAGVRITDDNRSDVLGDSTVSYDPLSNTLTLDNAKFTVKNRAFGIYATEDLTIDLVGKNSIAVNNSSATHNGIMAAIYTGGDLKICGDGKLYSSIRSSTAKTAYGIRVMGDLTLEAYVDVTIPDYLIVPYWGVRANRIYVNAPELVCHCENAITVDTGIYIPDTMRVFYTREEFDNELSQGKPCSLTASSPDEWPATIGIEPYWLSYNGIQITSENCRDIMGDGTVSYDEKTDTITLNNANHTLKGGISSYWTGDYIKINVVGENHITVNGSNFTGGLDDGVSIFGPGSLYLDLISSEKFGAAGIDTSWVSISNKRLDMTIRYHCDNPYEDEYSDTKVFGIRAYELTVECEELNIDVQSNIETYGIAVYGFDNIVFNNSNVSIKAVTTNPEKYHSTAIHCNRDVILNGGKLELLADTVMYAMNSLILPEGYVVKNAAEEFVNGTTTKLTQADPNVPVVIAPKTVAVPTLTGTGFTLSFEDEILVNFYYTAENAQDIAEQGMLVFYSNPGEADFAKADDVYTGSVLSNGAFANTTRGIAAKEMGDERYYCAYAKLTDGSYAYSALYSYSPEKYAKGRIQNSSNEELKALCVAMLNYGAAAQEFFGYRTDDLMNEGLTAEQQALVSDFDVALFAGAIPADTSKTVNFAKTETGFTKRSASISFEGAFAINYYFTPSETVAGDMKLYVWNAEAYEAAEVLTADNATVMTMENRNGDYFAPISGIAPKDLDKTFYVAGVYTDANGNTHCTGIIAYSLSRYCMNNANGSMGDLSQATAMYGYYADNYFA